MFKNIANLVNIAKLANRDFVFNEMFYEQEELTMGEYFRSQEKIGLGDKKDAENNHSEHAKFLQKIENLITKEQAYERSHGPELRPKEVAELKSWRLFPHSKDSKERIAAENKILEIELLYRRKYPNAKDKHVRELVVQNSLAVSRVGNILLAEPLSAFQLADLNSWLIFPRAHDGNLRKLFIQATLAKQELAEPLSPQQKAKVMSWREFPNPKDEHLRGLAKQESLSKENSTKVLSTKQVAELWSWREFPKNKYLRQLAKKEMLWFGNSAGAKPLTDAEETELYKERMGHSDFKDKYHQVVSVFEKDRKAGSPGKTLSKEEKVVLMLVRQSLLMPPDL